MQHRKHIKHHGFAPLTGQWKCLIWCWVMTMTLCYSLNCFERKNKKNDFIPSQCVLLLLSAAFQFSIRIKKLEVGYYWNVAWIRSWFLLWHTTVKSRVHWCSEQLRWPQTPHSASVTSTHDENTVSTSNQRVIHSVGQGRQLFPFWDEIMTSLRWLTADLHAGYWTSFAR